MIEPDLIFRALGDPTRRALYERLSRHVRQLETKRAAA